MPELHYDRGDLLRHVVSEGTTADVRDRQMLEVQFAAGGWQVAPTCPLIDAQKYSDTKLRPTPCHKNMRFRHGASSKWK